MRAVGWSARRPAFGGWRNRRGRAGGRGVGARSARPSGAEGSSGRAAPRGRGGIAAWLWLSVGGAPSGHRPEWRVVFAQTTGLVGLAVCETPHEVGTPVRLSLASPRTTATPRPCSQEGDCDGDVSSPESQLLLPSP